MTTVLFMKETFLASCLNSANDNSVARISSTIHKKIPNQTQQPPVPVRNADITYACTPVIYNTDLIIFPLQSFCQFLAKYIMDNLTNPFYIKYSKGTSFVKYPVGMNVGIC